MRARVVVVGPGALGRALGETLRAGGAEVAYIGRGGVASGPLAGAAVGLLCVKAYDTEAGVAAFRAALGEGERTPLVSLQNGLGNVERIAEALGPERAFGGATTHAARRLAGGEVVHVARGETAIAPFDRASGLERGRAIARLLSEHGLATRLEADLPALLFSKLAVSCAINAVTGLLGAPNGAIASDEDARAVALEAAREVARLAERLGIALCGGDPGERALAVARETAQNRSSLLQDLEAGRRTEVDFTNGAAAARAAELGLDLPVNRTLARLVRALERHRIAMHGTQGKKDLHA